MTAQNAFMHNAMNESFTKLSNGSIHTAFLIAMEASWGAFFYVMFFGMPFIIIWVKTKDFGVSMLAVLWGMALYGNLFPGTFASDYSSVLFLVGLAIMGYRAYSLAK